jgi:hypothetical protein
MFRYNLIIQSLPFCSSFILIYQTSVAGTSSRIMPLSLDTLPFDVLFYIASSLHLDDVVHLTQTCHQLKASLDEKTLNRCVVEVRGGKHQNPAFLTNAICRLSHTPRRPNWLVLEKSHTIKRFKQSTIGDMHYLMPVRSQLA